MAVKHLLTRSLLACALALWPTALLAQDYPTKPIRLVVPFAAGGPADTLARIIAPGMAERLGQSVVVENRPGAGGTTGVDAVAKAAPDGYTIGLTGAGAVTAAPFMMKVPYDAVKDLTPLSVVGRVNGVVVASAQSGFKTLSDLLAYAKANPGKVNFASAGSGTTIHLAGELLKVRGEVQIVHVPYRGAAPAITDLLAGQVQIMLPDLSGVLPHIRSGAIQALAVTSEKRSPALPDVPTTAEAGLPGLISDTWYGLIAPANLPPETRRKLHEAVTAAMKSPEVLQQVERQGAATEPTSGEEFAALIKADQEKWKPIIAATGAKME